MYASLIIHDINCFTYVYTYIHSCVATPKQYISVYIVFVRSCIIFWSETSNVLASGYIGVHIHYTRVYVAKLLCLLAIDLLESICMSC